MLPFAGNSIQRLIELGLANLGPDVTASGALNMEMMTSTDFDPFEFIAGKLLEMTLFDNTAPLEAYALIAVVCPEVCSCGLYKPVQPEITGTTAPLPVFDCDVTVCGLCVEMKYENAFSAKLCGFIQMITDYRNW